jgi:uncharacterized protein (TIGR02145 family)
VGILFYIRNMKKFVLCASLWIGLFLAACGDDSSVTSPSGKESLPTLTDSRDGQTYKTVVIGKQTWMAQNLNIETEKSFCFNTDSSNCTKYGRLYTWAAAMDSAGEWSSNGKGCGYKSECSAMSPVRGVCPNGWHLPTKAEFETLFSAVGGDSVAGKMLKSTSGWNFAKASGNGSDDYAFSALPVGYRDGGGDYTYVGNEATFWISTEKSDEYAYAMRLIYRNDNADVDYRPKFMAFSVRCVKD